MEEDNLSTKGHRGRPRRRWPWELAAVLEMINAVLELHGIPDREERIAEAVAFHPKYVHQLRRQLSGAERQFIRRQFHVPAHVAQDRVIGLLAYLKQTVRMLR